MGPLEAASTNTNLYFEQYLTTHISDKLLKRALALLEDWDAPTSICTKEVPPPDDLARAYRELEWSRALDLCDAWGSPQSLVVRANLLSLAGRDREAFDALDARLGLGACGASRERQLQIETAAAGFLLMASPELLPDLTVSDGPEDVLSYLRAVRAIACGESERATELLIPLPSRAGIDNRSKQAFYLQAHAVALAHLGRHAKSHRLLHAAEIATACLSRIQAVLWHEKQAALWIALGAPAEADRSIEVILASEVAGPVIERVRSRCEQLAVQPQCAMPI